MLGWTLYNTSTGERRPTVGSGLADSTSQRDPSLIPRIPRRLSWERCIYPALHVPRLSCMEDLHSHC